MHVYVSLEVRMLSYGELEGYICRCVLGELRSTFLRAGGVKISSIRDSIGDKGRGERLVGRRERLEA